MKLSLAPRRYVLAAIGIAFLAAGGLATLLPPGQAGAQQGPTIELLPPSGPCDAAIRVRGWAFERPPPGHATRRLELHLLQPGTTNVSMDLLSSALVDRDGAFSEWVGMWKHGCEAAALDSQAEQPSGHLVIAATLSQTKLPAGEPIPDIIATAEYAYATTTPHVPTEALSISPASGPCDAAVQVTGSGFEPGMEVRLKLGRPGSDASLGTLASAVADEAGEFTVQFSLGELGCEAAELNMIVGDPTRPELAIWAYPATRPTPVPPGIPPVLAGVGYTFITTVPTAGPPAQTLPTTGSGPTDDGGTAAFIIAGLVGLAAGGLLIGGACLYGRRRRT